MVVATCSTTSATSNGMHAIILVPASCVESLEMRRRLGDAGGIAFSLNSLGDVLIDEGKIADALPVLK